MLCAERSELGRAQSREGDPYDAVVIRVTVSDHESGVCGAVHELDCTVVSEQEVVGKVSDRGSSRSGVPADGEQELMLHRCEPGFSCLAFAPTQETPHRGPQLQERCIVTIGQRFILHRGQNISWHDMNRETWARFRARVRAAVRTVVASLGGPFWWLVVLVGLVSGVVGAVFVETLKRVTAVLGPSEFSRATHLLVFGVVGVVIALLTRYLGSPGDVELLVDNIHVMGGRSDIRDLRSLLPVSLLGIGAGSAIGPEAPLVQTTGSLGSWLALRRRLGVSETRILTITGMAAGFTVLFGAPLGSAIFALEILHRRGLQYYEALLPAGIGALSGYIVYVVTTGLGLTPLWHFVAPTHLHLLDLGVGLAAGVVGALVAAAFSYLTRLFRQLFQSLPALTRPVLGGLALGGLAFVSPYAVTFGEGQIQHIVTAKLAVVTLVVAAAAKLCGSSMIVSSGWRGGFIIPLFFIGAALGAAATHIGGITEVVAVTTLMAAVNVGVTKTPFGSTLVVCEMAGIRLLPPVLLASIVSLLLTSRVALIETQRERTGALEGPEPN
jgi:H+/Cl- antiporter ClcA